MRPTKPNGVFRKGVDPRAAIMRTTRRALTDEHGRATGDVDAHGRAAFLLASRPAAGRMVPAGEPAWVCWMRAATRLGIASPADAVREDLDAAAAVVRSGWTTFPQSRRDDGTAWLRVPESQRIMAAPLQTAVTQLQSLAAATEPASGHARLLGRCMQRALARGDQLLSFLAVFQWVALGECACPDVWSILERADALATQCGVCGADVDFFLLATERRQAVAPWMQFGCEAEILCARQITAAQHCLTSIPRRMPDDHAILFTPSADFVLNGRDGIEVKYCGSAHPDAWTRLLDGATAQLRAFEADYPANLKLGPRDRYLVIYHTLTHQALERFAIMAVNDPGFGRAFTRVVLVPVIRAKHRDRLQAHAAAELTATRDGQPRLIPFDWTTGVRPIAKA